MAAGRKLQSEVDKTLKKIDEGIEEFKGLWDKANQASTPSQKEKVEADLKKDIKKLQRYREQLKTWIQQSDVKDKRPLEDARKRIENEMGRFKVFEKDSKTKAYSNEGLSNHRADPLEEKKEEHRRWITKAIQSLETKKDELDAEEEAIQGKKKRLPADLTREEDVKKQIRRHMWHMAKMELVLRRMDNDAIDLEELSSAKESIEYYVEECDDPDFYFDETVYDPFHLDDVEQPIQRTSADLESPGGGTVSPVVGSPLTGPKAAPAPLDKALSGLPGLPPAAAAVPATASTSPAAKAPETKKKERTNSASSAEPPAPKEEPKARPAVPATGPPATAPPAPPAPPSAPPPFLPPGEPETRQAPAGRPPSPPPVAPPAGPPGGPPTAPPPTAPPVAPPPPSFGAAPPPRPKAGGPPPSLPPPPPSQLPPAPPPREEGSPSEGELPGVNDRAADQPRGPPPEQPPPPLPSSPAGQPPLEEKKTARTHEADLTLIDASFAHIQQPEDSIRARKYMPTTPHSHVDSEGKNPFPTTPALTDAAQLKAFEGLEFDTLFFVFYFQQGTYEQYLAARELKRMSWRYHLKYHLWFQRHEEPTVTTPEYEQGTYIYFEYEYDWCQRIKPDFTFEYQHLEDERL